MKKIIAIFCMILILSTSYVTAQSTRDNDIQIFTSSIEETGESIIVNVGKLEPTIVPTNILEEQDVPVYVFLEGATLGSLAFGEDAPENFPFYGIPEIERVSISNVESTNNMVSNVVHIKPKDRKYVIGDNGRFFDMGYLILKLRKVKDEKDLPQFNDTALARVNDDSLELLRTGGPTIDAKITMDIRFNTENSFGAFGAQDLRLTEQINEKEWIDGTDKTSFWGRNGYIRADKIRDDGVTLSVYDGRNRRIQGVTLTKNGDESTPIRLREFGPVENSLFRIRLNNVVVPKDSAEFTINGDIYNLIEGQRLYPGSNWKVEKIRNNVEVKDDNGKVTALYDEVTLVGKDGQRKSLKIVSFGELVIKTGEVKPQTDITRVDRTTAGYLAYENKFEPGFIDEVEKTSSRLKINPNHLMAVMAFETGGSFSPSEPNKAGSSGIGLIQFLSSTADSLGTSTNALKSMNQIKQLEYVEKYYKQYVGKIRQNSLEDVYMAVLYPEAVGKPDTTRILYRSGEYEPNKGLDFNLGDGKIEVREAVSKLRERYNFGSSQTVVTSTDSQQQFVTYLSDENVCINVNFEDNEAFKTSNQLYCKSIQEIEEAIAKGLTGETLNEAYYRLGQAHDSVGKDNLYHKREAILAYENIKEGNLYDLAQDKKQLLEKEIDGKVNTAGASAFLEDENLEVVFRSIRSVKEKDKASVTLNIDTNQRVYNVGDAVASGSDEQNKNFNWVIESISSDKIVLRQNFEQSEISGRRETIRLNDVIALQTGKDKTVTVQILDIDTKRQAYITILPGSGKAISRSVVDVKIPIERRAIQFNTEQIDWQINKTRAVIKKLDSIIDKLDATVRVWKATCLGVFAFISVTNLLDPSVEGETRNLVMKGIDGKSGFGAYCNEHSGLNKDYTSYDECIFKNQAYIEKRINEEKQNIIAANDYVDTKYITDYSKYKFDEKSAPLISKQDARELNLLELQIKTSESNVNTATGASLDIEKRNLEALKEQLKIKQENFDKTTANFNKAKKYADDVSGNADIKDVDKTKLREEAFTVKLNELSQITSTGIRSDDFANLKPITFVQGKAFDENGKFLDHQEVKGSEYVTELNAQIEKEQDNTKKTKLEALKNKIAKNPDKIVVTDDGKTVYKAGNDYYYSETEDYLGLRVRRTYARPNVAEYYENGRPFCVPVGEGNYVRVLEYYADGTAKTVDERNVGTNGVMCDEDDVIINSDSLVKLNPQKEQELKRAAARAGTCASGTYKVGSFVCSHAKAKAAQAATELHCTDVMSINDCKILFNVCDPVMCPTSRFNLGGKWQVNSVPETGIIGSIVLGWGNFGKTNVVPPVCLPGVLSGLEGMRSVFQGYEQCLQTSKVSGQTVGICDKVKSVFICENVWRETVAITGSVGGFSAFSGKLFGNVDGGGEYAPNEFGKRLKQTSDSAKFFASDYATSSLASYEARSLREAGSQICRNIYAGKAPGIGKLIDQITTPESPPQFTAFFDEYPWSSDTGDTRLNVGAGLFSDVKEQSRYSVFYHIYAGRATDVRYSVYLKDRLGNIAYVTERAGGRSRGFIPREEFASKNIDFIGKSGFTEICVEINGRETCGFGRSSTDFGVNYLNDWAVTNELQKEINTKEQCVPDNKAGPTLKGIATPENINTGDVTGGIVRVCSHQNPGEGGNEARWQVVGNCGNDKEKIDLGNCWIDTTTIRINDLNITEQTIQNIINKYDVKDGELSLGLSKEEFSQLLINNDALIADYGFPSILDRSNKLSDNAKNDFVKTIGTEDDETSLRFIAGHSIDYGAVAQLRIGEIYLTLANDLSIKNGIEISKQQGEQQPLTQQNTQLNEEKTSPDNTYTLQYSPGIGGELHVIFKGLQANYYIKNKPNVDEGHILDYPVYKKVNGIESDVGYISSISDEFTVNDNTLDSKLLNDLNIDLDAVTTLFKNRKGGTFSASSGKLVEMKDVSPGEQKLSDQKKEGEEILSNLISDENGILRYTYLNFYYGFPVRSTLYYKNEPPIGWQWSPDKENWMPVTDTVIKGGKFDGESPTQDHLDFIVYLKKFNPSLEFTRENILSNIVNNNFEGPDKNNVYTYDPVFDGTLTTFVDLYYYKKTATGWQWSPDKENWMPVTWTTVIGGRDNGERPPQKFLDVINTLSFIDNTAYPLESSKTVVASVNSKAEGEKALSKLVPEESNIFRYNPDSRTYALYYQYDDGNWLWSTQKSDWKPSTQLAIERGQNNVQQALPQSHRDFINYLGAYNPSINAVKDAVSVATIDKLDRAPDGTYSYTPISEVSGDTLRLKETNNFWDWKTDKTDWKPVATVPDTVVGDILTQEQLDVLNSLKFVQSAELQLDEKEEGEKVLSKLIPDRSGSIFEYDPSKSVATDSLYYKFNGNWLWSSDKNNWEPVSLFDTEETSNGLFTLPRAQRDFISYLENYNPTIDAVQDKVLVSTIDKLDGPAPDGTYAYLPETGIPVAITYYRENNQNWEFSFDKTDWKPVASAFDTVRADTLVKDQIDIFNSLNFAQSTEQIGSSRSIFSVGLNGKRIVIDPGHGGIDRGTSYNVNGRVIKESDLVLEISKKLKAEFEKNGAIVFMTRDDNTNFDLLPEKKLGFYTRKKIANSYNSDLFLSIHVNDLETGCSDGTQIFIYCAENYKSLGNDKSDFVSLGKCNIKNEYFDESLKAAQEIQPLIVNYIGTKNKGISGADFSVLQDDLGVKVEAPAMLIELGYLCDAGDRAKLLDIGTQEKIAISVVEGTNQYFA